MSNDKISDDTMNDEKSSGEENLILRREDKDQIFASNSYPKPFEFNEQVARVFDDMAVRSIPLYEETIRSSVDWALDFYQSESKIIDIGCSTGTCIAAIAANSAYKINFVGVDSSASMIKKARIKLKSFVRDHSIDLKCEDALLSDYSGASVVIMNYTLQFVSITKRAELLQKIFDNMLDNGILFISDKLTSSCKEFNETIVNNYHAFKKSNNYSSTEIERKKETLENVLLPLSFEDEVSLIKNAGFSSVEPILKWNNFCSFVAIKKCI
jgi:tRNA (cmo5U34)-methyltransferase